ncbi:MAG: YrhK family protein [Tomitella sp.]|nr:YrhK family protein [Tomitella sp.]
MNASVERFRRLVTDFQSAHQGIGVLGGVAFFVGQHLLPRRRRPAAWLFIVGSAGMMIGDIGSALITYERDG